jgi:hypothetical protein
MLSRVLPGLPNNGRCTDDEQITPRYPGKRGIVLRVSANDQKPR